MKIILYAREPKGHGGRLQQEIETFVDGIEIEVYRSKDSLAHRLRQAEFAAFKIAVLLATDKEDLGALKFIQDLVTDVPVIMVLPDSDEETVAAGHLFRPRYLTYTDGNFSDVAAVLEKMVGRVRNI